ncbi:MAG: hypothetical protein ACFB2W_00920 [Leptolyngbyaceae cyanobacterium]
MTYIHPPTDCTDRAARNHVINNADIKAELREYWRRSAEIWQKLPVTIDGVTFTHWWQLDFEEHVLPVCRAEKPAQKFLEAYVYLALRHLFKGLREASKS